MSETINKENIKWWDFLIPIFLFIFLQVISSIVALIYSLISNFKSFDKLMDGNFTNFITQFSNKSFGYAVLASSVLTIFLVLIYLKIRKISLKEVGFISTTPKAFAFVAIVTVLLLGFQLFYDVIINLIGANANEQAELLVAIFGKDTTGLLTLFITVVILAPFLEETLFRGLLFNYLDKHTGFNTAALISALVFAFLHLNTFYFPVFIIIGYVLAYSYKKYESIWPPIALHALNNGIFTLILILNISKF